MVESAFDFQGPGAHVEARWNDAQMRVKHVKRDNWTANISCKPGDFPDWEFIASDEGGGRTDTYLWKRVRPNGAFGTPDQDYLYIISGNEIGETYFGVAVASDSLDVISDIIGRCKEKYPEAAKKPTDVRVNFWYMTPQGPQAISRALDAPTWEEIKGNYPSIIKTNLSSLMSEWVPGVGGKLLLWQGPAGVGKTYAIRALAREWKDWCKISYITDIEEFFSRSAYMLNVLLRDDGELQFHPETGIPSRKNSEKWHLVILEDAGELIAKDAKQKTGAALSKLLNITDGLIGQGLRVMLLITTNEELGALHEAVSRPGRCASKLSFGELSVTERAEWAKKRGIEIFAGATTLAELYALERGQVIEKPKQVGFVPA